jgi:hypothetical protein
LPAFKNIIRHKITALFFPAEELAYELRNHSPKPKLPNSQIAKHIPWVTLNGFSIETGHSNVTVT